MNTTVSKVLTRSEQHRQDFSCDGDFVLKCFRREDTLKCSTIFRPSTESKPTPCFVFKDRAKNGDRYKCGLVKWCVL